MVIDREVIAGAVLAAALCAQVSGAAGQEDPVAGLFGVSLFTNAEDARARLGAACGSLSVHQSARAVLPVARSDEGQIICTGFAARGWKFDEVAFVFADGGLQAVEAYGGSAGAAFDQLPGEPFPYAGFLANREALGFLGGEADRLVFLSGEAAHAHMLLWHSPFLRSNAGEPADFPAGAAQPAILRFGESLDVLRPEFQASCGFLVERAVSNPMLAEISGEQTQLDCFGLVYAGFPRKIEAVFADGRLEMAWILTGKAEEDRLRHALSAEHGAPVESGEDWDIFDGGQVALRKDLPEVLYLSGRAKALFREAFGLE